MSILNRRNALFGYAVWQTGKRLMAMKAKRATGAGAGTKAWVVRVGAGVAAAVGAAWVVRRLTGGGDSTSDE
jgi:hypothetical protein